ncbi:hypothetical protein EXT48_12780 [Pseudoalteromonas sp. CO348]|uniref:hypothetical protein n=1 Tax=Pseudoalteromonas TaxID=53246 RepID=UPI00083DDA13|nr:MULTISPECIES: hypothetical protein [Pseudoalteromonas]MCG7541180.1 hypothetical protein [Pseudoalteromonas sp. OF7H-1]MCG9769752.1 hypothetical protein [Pseudoalteromonas piscicida]ODB35671.1 hypothetical protein BB427_17040 [Pseudoalteromonas sp. BMB]RZG04429.1 hypothetical protein EXT48_12780 [Pseudoalteromonas sp. CO348]
MKLSSVLSLVNQVEKSKFINAIDRICLEAVKHDNKIATQLNKLDGQIKNATSNDITQLFKIVLPHFEKSVKEQLAMLGAQATLLTNILSRDGNCIARVNWIESLYTKEWELIDSKANELRSEIASISDDDIFSEGKRLGIYHACLKEAYSNDERNNREAKITDDERGILNVLAKHLDVTSDNQAGIEHLIDQIPKNGVQDAINDLREIGLVFVSRKRQTVYVPDEIVSLFHRLQGKELADKHLLRILRTFTDAELSNVLKNHRKKIRGVERKDKIVNIIKLGLSVTQILKVDMFSEGTPVNDCKDRLKTLIQDLDLELDKFGSTIEERIDLILNALNQSSEREFNALSATGFKELFSTLQNHFPSLATILKQEFELEEQEELDVEKLRALSITPYDILYMLTNDEVKSVVESMGIKKRGNLRLNILSSFADATDKLIDNYGALARRDLTKLKSENIEVAEAELGVKFEEVTKAIFEQLGLEVDEDLRRSINTSKDKADILISLSEDDVIVGEAKTCKNGDFAKYSTTSRQVKSYVGRCEGAGKRVAQVLIVAPSFSDDFVESAEMDTEVNISLLEADGLKRILDAYRARRKPKFSAKLFTKGGLLKADLIAKNI